MPSSVSKYHPWRKVDTERAHQTRILAYLWRRELPRRAFPAGLVLLLAFVKQLYIPATILACAIVCVEYLVNTICRRVDRKPDGMRMLYVYQVVSVCVVMNLLYGAIAMLLVTVPSFAIAVVGLMWSLGALIYVSNSYSSVPTYYWASFIPQVVTTIASLFSLTQHPINNSSGFEWMATASLCGLFIHTSIQVLFSQQETQKKLDQARREAEERSARLEYISQHDQMTGLLNRRAFDERLADVLDEKHGSLHLAVFLVDLDKFKPINDSFGHEAGDEVLRMVGERIHSFIGPQGFAARLGGDELAIVRRDITNDAKAMQIGQEIVASIRVPIPFEEESLTVGASVGIACADRLEPEVAVLCGSADQAMFSAKEDNSISVAMFDPELIPPRPSIQDRNNLLRSIEDREIRPFFQSKVDMRTGEIIGFEALARWVHPERGLISPGEFIPLVDQLGLKADFTNSMTEQVLEAIEFMHAEGHGIKSVSINVAEEVLATETGLQGLIDMIQEYPEASKSLTIEVTEDVVISRSGDAVTNAICQLADLGLRISLDDFGTGFASFQHLRQLKFHELKIDDSFVRRIGEEDTSEIIVDSFLAIAAGLCVESVAEGVETEEQRKFLLERGCEIGQGFLYAEAEPIEWAMEMLRQQKEADMDNHDHQTVQEEVSAES